MWKVRQVGASTVESVTAGCIHSGKCDTGAGGNGGVEPPARCHDPTWGGSGRQAPCHGGRQAGSPPAARAHSLCCLACALFSKQAQAELSGTGKGLSELLRSHPRAHPRGRPRHPPLCRRPSCPSCPWAPPLCRRPSPSCRPPLRAAAGGGGQGPAEQALLVLLLVSCSCLLHHPRVASCPTGRAGGPRLAAATDAHPAPAAATVAWGAAGAGEGGCSVAPPQLRLQPCHRQRLRVRGQGGWVLAAQAGGKWDVAQGLASMASGVGARGARCAMGARVQGQGRICRCQVYICQDTT